MPAPRFLLTLLALLGGCSTPQPPNIAIVQVDPGKDRLDTRRQAAQRFYAAHRDDYDFLVMWHNGDPRLNAQNYLPVKNDVTGIGYGNVGEDTFDRAGQYGSARLQGIVWMGNDWPALDVESVILPVLAEECGHRWGATMHYASAAGEQTLHLRGDELHWSALAVTGGSPMGGGNWQPAGGRTWQRSAATHSYADFDLYAMGFVTLPEVAPMTLLVNVTGDGCTVDCAAAFRDAAPDEVEADAETIAIEQVVAAEGPRLPDGASSPRSFRQAWIYLASDGTAPDPAQLERLDRMRVRWEAFFAAATRGRATLRATLD